MTEKVKGNTRGINSPGFTLVEVLVTLLLLVGLLAVVYEGFLSQAVAFKQQSRKVNRLQGLRAALEALARDMRLAGYPDRERTGRLLRDGWFPAAFIPSGSPAPLEEPITIVPGGRSPTG